MIDSRDACALQLLPLFMLVTLCFTVMCIDNKNLNERLGLTFTLLLASIGYTSQLRDHLPKCASWLCVSSPSLLPCISPTPRAIAVAPLWHAHSFVAEAPLQVRLSHVRGQVTTLKPARKSTHPRSGPSAAALIGLPVVRSQVHLALHLCVRAHRHGIAACVPV